MFRAGAGEAVVLLHGAVGTWRHWRPVLPALSARFDVVAPSIVRPVEKPVILVAYTDPFKNQASAPLDVKSLALTCENRPVLPDSPDATTLADLTSHTRGWLERVDAALFGTGLRVAATVARRDSAGAGGP